MRTTCAVLFALVASASVHGAEIHVQPRQSIQAAIDAAAAFDHVVVHPGTYAQTIDFKGKSIVVRSTNGPLVTTIDATTVQLIAVRFVSNEPSSATLDGFTVRGGAGGIEILQSQPTVRNCVLRGNHSANRGGGIWVSGVASNPLIEDCVFEGNSSLLDGGGVSAQQGAITIRRSVFRGNVAQHDGGGIALFDSTSVVEDCTVSENHAAGLHGGGMHILLIGGRQVVVRRTSVLANFGPQSGGISCLGILTNATASATLESVLAAGNGGAGVLAIVADDETHAWMHLENCSLIANDVGFEGAHMPSPKAPYFTTLRNCLAWGNTTIAVTGFVSATACDTENILPGAGNFSADPLFVAPQLGDCHLRADSPCRDAGAAPADGPFDWEGDPRVAGTGIDIGADEFHAHLYHDVVSSSRKADVGVHVIGEPGASAMLIVGLAAAPTPVATPVGSLFVAPPWFLLPPLGSIPATGLLTAPYVVRPSGLPFAFFAQALVNDELSNLDVSEAP